MDLKTIDHSLKVSNANLIKSELIGKDKKSRINW